MSDKKLIYEKMAAILKDVPAVGKNKKSTAPGQGGYSFRGIDDVIEALTNTLAAHQVFYSPTVLEDKREERPSKSGGLLIYTILKIRFDFFTIDGSSVSATVIGEAMDSGDKSANKAMSAAQKYCLTQIFNIPTAEPKDTENHNPDPAPPTPPQAAPPCKPRAPRRSTYFNT